jgi:transposase
LIRYEADDMGRFARPDKFAAYCGPVPSTYQSGEHVRHGRLIRQGNRWLRRAFIEAVGPACRSSARLARVHRRIAARRGIQAARVAVARKLALLAWTICTEKRYYEER